MREEHYSVICDSLVLSQLFVSERSTLEKGGRMSNKEQQIDESELGRVAGGIRRAQHHGRRVRAGRERGGDLMAPVDVAALAHRHGIPFGDSLVTATAIAGAESGFHVNSTNHNRNGTVDKGLWQINSIHPRWFSYNPDTNAAGMAALSRGGQRWHDWVAYNNGSYRRYLPEARRAVEQLRLRQGGV